MKTLMGTKLDRFPLAELNKVTDLIHFEGPLLSVFTNNQGDKFLYYWCDGENDRNRWLVFRVSDRDLDAYLTKRVTLKDLISNPSDGFVYAADIEASAKIAEVHIVDPRQLPDDYLADDNSYYDFISSSLRMSEQSFEKKVPETYTIAIDGKWTFEDLAEMPKIYSTVYAFMHSLRSLRRHMSDRVKYAYRAHPWRGGYSAVNFFKDLLSDIDPEHDLQIVSMRYASPGWIELKVSPQVAFSVKSIVASFVASGDELEALYKEIYAELRDRRLLRGGYISSSDLSEPPTIYETPTGSDASLRGHRATGKLRQPSQPDGEFALTAAWELAQLLKLETEDFQQINLSTADPLITLKILLAVYRRIRVLAEYYFQGKAEY